MFGVFDWNQIAKVDPLPGSNNGLTITGTQQEGTWTIAQSIFDAWQRVMLVFKGGNDNNTFPGSVVGYLIQDLTGDYESPLLNSRNFNPRDISHVSLYVSTPSPIPLPAAGVLLIGALGGLGLLARRRRAAA
jgi:hypothetical protein